MDNDELVRATQLLNECLESIIQPVMDQFGTLDFQITGIDHMTDNPSKVHVLFGVVKSEALQLVADRIMDRFVEHGIYINKQSKRSKIKKSNNSYYICH